MIYFVFLLKGITSMSFRSLNASVISVWLDWCINSKLSKIQIVANAEMVKIDLMKKLKKMIHS